MIKELALIVREYIESFNDYKMTIKKFNKVIAQYKSNITTKYDSYPNLCISYSKVINMFDNHIRCAICHGSYFYKCPHRNKYGHLLQIINEKMYSRQGRLNHPDYHYLYELKKNLKRRPSEIKYLHYKEVNRYVFW